LAKPGTIIQIAPGNYGESLVIKTPDLIIESAEEDGKVVLLAGKKPWVTVAIDTESKLEMNRIRMIHMGPNSQTMFTQKIDMNYETEGNAKCMIEFNLAKSVPGVLKIISGNVTLNRCVLSLNGVAPHLTEKVPCIACLNDTSLMVNNWFLFGDSNHEVITSGIVGYEPYEVIVKDTVVKDHLGGGIMLTLAPFENTKFQIMNNKILNCQTAGVFVQGENSFIEIEGNEIKNCRAVGIKIADLVKAEIRENQLFENNDGIQILNNSSHMVANEIEKSHGHGISVISEHHDGKYTPVLKGNTISNWKFNGIQVSGDGVRAGIYNNTEVWISVGNRNA
jgi:hypothetical protein